MLLIQNPLTSTLSTTSVILFLNSSFLINRGFEHSIQVLITSHLSGLLNSISHLFILHKTPGYSLLCSFHLCYSHSKSCCIIWLYVKKYRHLWMPQRGFACSSTESLNLSSIDTWTESSFVWRAVLCIVSLYWSDTSSILHLRPPKNLQPCPNVLETLFCIHPFHIC